MDLRIIIIIIIIKRPSPWGTRGLYSSLCLVTRSQYKVNTILLYTALLCQGRVSQVLSGYSHMNKPPCFLAFKKSIFFPLKAWSCNAFTPQHRLSLRRKDLIWFAEWSSLAALCILVCRGKYSNIELSNLLKCNRCAFLDLFDPAHVCSHMIFLHLVYSSLQCGKRSWVMVLFSERRTKDYTEKSCKYICSKKMWEHLFRNTIHVFQWAVLPSYGWGPLSM